MKGLTESSAASGEFMKSHGEWSEPYLDISIASLFYEYGMSHNHIVSRGASVALYLTLLLQATLWYNGEWYNGNVM